MARQGSLVGRVAAVAALVIALVGVSLVVFGGGSNYSVKAVFITASPKRQRGGPSLTLIGAKISQLE